MKRIDGVCDAAVPNSFTDTCLLLAVKKRMI